ncbi:MAG: 5-(carboxyamino)imidazole ribonucleotide synthase [Flavobacteriales bacterium]|nr:5-(carboxyamino)imidazole ribonucleotide synthase [Flavobacteriales bacterium]
MLIQEAINYDVRVAVLDPTPDAPCSAVSHEFVCGSFNDYQSVLDFGQRADVITIEIEHVNVEALLELEKAGKKVFPKPSFIQMVQDKGLQKKFYADHQIPTAPFHLINDKSELSDHMPTFPFVLKSRTGGYDGKGVMVIRNTDDLKLAFSGPCVVEEMVNIQKEIAVIVARNEQGEIAHFPLVEMEFNPEANLVEFLFSPASVPVEAEREAYQIAHKIVSESDFVGLLAVEMFLDHHGNVIVNEMAPRPHNSGHHTIEACATSQYGQLLRAITGMPLGNTELIRPAVMINLLGEKGYSGMAVYEGMNDALKIPGVFFHLYGKSETKPFRKMGHITVTSPNLEEAKSTARGLLQSVRVIA